MSELLKNSKFLNLSDEELDERINEAQRQLSRLEIEKKLREKSSYDEDKINKFYKITHGFNDVTFIKVLYYEKSSLQNGYTAIYFSIDEYGIDFGMNTYGELDDCKEITEEEYNKNLEFAIKRIRKEYNSNITYEKLIKGDD